MTDIDMTVHVSLSSDSEFKQARATQRGFLQWGDSPEVVERLRTTPPHGLLIQEPDQDYVSPPVGWGQTEQTSRPVFSVGSVGTPDVADVKTYNTNPFQCDAETLASVSVDIIASLGFWSVILFMYFPSWLWTTIYILTPIAMLVWRAVRVWFPEYSIQHDLPYTCAYVRRDGKEMLLIATLHIAPRSPKDVHAVVGTQNPDSVMIELDEERLARMRAPADDPEVPKIETSDLQAVRIERPGQPTLTILTQRAIWNAEWAGDTVEGPLAFDEVNAHGMKTDSSVLRGSIAVIKRGSADGSFAPFSLKSHLADKYGAKALIVVANKDELPNWRLGVASFEDELKVWRVTCNCGFPPVPMLLTTKSEGERLMKLCNDSDPGSVKASIQLMDDDTVRRTLRKRVCQGIGLFITGIGILYGIIRFCAVEVGLEFLEAEVASQQIGVPCVCIDVDLNSFWQKLSSEVIPYPRNIVNALWCWLAFPRVAFNFLFPPRGSIDSLGTMLVQLASFPAKTWFAFGVSGIGASLIVSLLFSLVTMLLVDAGESTGVVDSDFAADFQAALVLGIQLYIMPQVYTAIAASRDETMYQQIVKKSRLYEFKRFVVVVGGGHANGIIARANEFGF